MRRREFLTAMEQIMVHLSYWRLVRETAWPGSGVRDLADRQLIMWRAKLEAIGE